MRKFCEDWIWDYGVMIWYFVWNIESDRIGFGRIGRKKGYGWILNLMSTSHDVVLFIFRFPSISLDL